MSEVAVRVNGEEIRLPEGGVGRVGARAPEGLDAARGGRAQPRDRAQAEYAETRLAPGDVLEVVEFVGGG